MLTGDTLSEFAYYFPQLKNRKKFKKKKQKQNELTKNILLNIRSTEHLDIITIHTYRKSNKTTLTHQSVIMSYNVILSSSESKNNTIMSC